MERYRVFISYSHDNKDDVKMLADILRGNHLNPIYDENLPAGGKFDDLIKKYIEHSHVFMPLITAESAQRGWVHQEIGYAMAMNIPVLPVVKGQLPPAMIQKFHAISFDKAAGIEKKLSYDVFENLVENCSVDDAVYYCREQPEERAMKMAEMAEDVTNMGFEGFLRQKGGLSSFQIPNKSIKHAIWEQRYDTVLKNDFHCKCQLSERKALEPHAMSVGCRLIINPQLILDHYSDIAKKARLGTFLEFLRRVPPDKIDIAIDKKMTFDESVTMVGDWFCAESYFRSETQGFMQTIFTRYSPGIRDKIIAFDNEFSVLLNENGVKEGESLTAVTEYIAGLLDGMN